MRYLHKDLTALKAQRRHKSVNRLNELGNKREAQRRGSVRGPRESAQSSA